MSLGSSCTFPGVTCEPQRLPKNELDAGEGSDFDPSLVVLSFGNDLVFSFRIARSDITADTATEG